VTAEAGIRIAGPGDAAALQCLVINGQFIDELYMGAIL
jgi:hypothetical protein